MNTQRRATFLNAWQVLGSAVGDVRDIGVMLVGFNLLWFFTSVLIITAPPATLALAAITHELGYRRPVGWRDFFRFMGRYFGVGWRWGLINLAVIIIYVANLLFYTQLDAPLNFLGRGFWTLALILWLLVQMYTLPLLLEQETPHVRLALRNAFVLLLRHSTYTLAFALVAIAFSVASILVAYFWMFFTVALLLYFYGRGVWYLVRLERGEEPEV